MGQPGRYNMQDSLLSTCIVGKHVRYLQNSASDIRTAYMCLTVCQVFVRQCVRHVWASMYVFDSLSGMCGTVCQVCVRQCVSYAWNSVSVMCGTVCHICV